MRRMGVPNRYMRATLMYSGNVLLCVFTNEMRLPTSSKKVLSGWHCSMTMFAV
jgi:hypothetical protein